MQPRLHQAFVNGSLILGGCVVAFIIIEIILRIFHPFEFRIRGDRIVLPTNRRYTIRHAQSTQLDPTVTYTKNSIGFRGEELPVGHESYLKVITIGGSTTEDSNLTDDRTWSYQLGQRLQRSFSRLWLNNAGMSGLSSNGQLILLQEYIVKLRPTVVVFLTGINDMGMRGHSSDQWITGQRVRWWETILARSEVAYLSVQLYRYARGNSFVKAHSFRIDMAPHFEGVVDADRIRAEYESYLGPYRQRLDAHVTTSRENGIEPVFVTQPALYGDVADDITGIAIGTLDVQGMPGWLAWEVLERYNETMREVARTRGVFFVDLARTLPKSSRYFYDFIHFTNNGAERVADIIYTHLCPFLAARYPTHAMQSCGTM